MKATAWVRIVSFPSMRLLIEANKASGVHIALDYKDTSPNVDGWQQLSVGLTIPLETDHLAIVLGSAVLTGEGIAYGDDVQLCLDGVCSGTCSGTLP